MFIKAKDFHLYRSSKLIDVRDPDEYAQGHLANAVNAYDLFSYLLSRSSENDLEEMKRYFKNRFGQLGISGEEHLIIYEKSLNNQYGASCRAFFILKYMKHPNVSTLEGGLDALIRLEGEKHEITKELPLINECQYHGEDSSQSDYQIVGRDEVLELINKRHSGRHLLDVRDAIEWNGLSSSPYGIDYTPRKGRIPYSIWIEWYQFHQMDEQKNVIQIKPNEDIRTMMENEGIQQNDQIIVYCFKGSRASVALMALKQAGYNNVKNYFASWNEWSRDFQLPIDEQIYIQKQN